MTAVQRVLFVCEGNICRSPFAEATFRQEWALATGQPIAASSGGTRAPAGRPAHDAVRALASGTAEEALAGHRSQRVTPAHLRDHDLVVTMERAHRSALMDLDPRALRRTFTLGELGALDAVLEQAGVGTLHADTTLTDLVGQHRLAIAAESQDVADPVGGDDEDFARMAEQVRSTVHRLVALLLRWGAPVDGGHDR